ncbi:MAG: HAD family phosphatase [Phycisphaeraceae bacterium]
MLKAIVFDFDGVIADSEPLHYRAFLDVLEPIGIGFDYAEYLARLVGFDDRDAMRHMLERHGQPADDGAVDAMCARKQAAFDAQLEAGVEALPGALDLVDAAAAAMPIAVASGATRKDVLQILDSLRRRDRFAAIVSADDVARSKPDPESYRAAVAALARLHTDLAIEPAHCLAIEDTPTGLASARDAGLRTLAVGSTYPVSELASSAERVVGSLVEVDVARLRDWFGH